VRQRRLISTGTLTESRPPVYISTIKRLLETGKLLGIDVLDYTIIRDGQPDGVT
jgi:hypothetical protein